VNPIAHIGNVPVEEWLPFLFPVLALYLYGRHWSRRRRQAVARLPDASELLDEGMVRRVVARWSAADHTELSLGLVPLFYPPGPEGMTAAELAARIHRDPVAIEQSLEELQELGYLDLEDREDLIERRVWLTIEGQDLLDLTEDELLTAAAVPRQPKAR
jgi:hypothetical protein